MATAIFAIIELTLFLTFKHNFYHAAPSLVLSKLYSNSMMVLLNNRVSLRYGKQSTFESSQLSSAYARETLGERSAGPIQVNISRGLETYGSESIAMGPVTSHSPSERQKASLDLTGDHDLPSAAYLCLFFLVYLLGLSLLAVLRVHWLCFAVLVNTKIGRVFYVFSPRMLRRDAVSVLQRCSTADGREGRLYGQH
ncbi:hypothetical protein A0H81_06411 [Grifola frondosa]|uniref:Uncharacterized protein n=1 Tax=Grifola frondosa TaxID=5627 RepID=A0A1C7MAU6_GRIFR|nr:hypothetical protein A0H81_06411 [Grifola frondosa]